MTSERIKNLISQLTLEEKAGLCSGADFWHTKAVGRLGIPSVMVADGPHGLRKQDESADHLGIHDSIKAVCFPAGCALASSFDKELVETVGAAIGQECQAEGVGILLGPAVNIKRSPLCGRNFEYYSEDPTLAGELAAAFIRGVQSENVGTSIKHYLANNQETRRMSVSAEADERTMREIYMRAFEIPVTRAQPWSVMCSYNRINGVYAPENKKYLTDVLRGEWGFDGFVMSDWGAVNDRVPDLEAGLELEMPFSGGGRDTEIAEAVRNGALNESVLDTAVERILNIVFRFAENRDRNAIFDRGADHTLAGKAAAESAVLLKNDMCGDRPILPLKEGMTVAFIGLYAEKPRFQGGGSSHINASRITSAMDAAPPGVIYARGFDDQEDRLDDSLVLEAINAASTADAAVVFAGLPEAWESEGFDRPHMRMPESQNTLIEKIAEVQPDTIVILHNGAPVEMPWIGKVRALLEVYLGGEAIGGAVVDLLYGKVNPSGRLPETFPLKLEDNPSFLNFPGDGDRVEYREGVYVGYRYYEKKKMDVLFPFGFGLSYTTFAYDNFSQSSDALLDTQTLTVTADVTNTGNIPGREVVQLYVSIKASSISRPVKELRGFEKILLQPGEKKTVTFTLGRRDFAYYNETMGGWHAESGDYEVIIAKSAAEPMLTGMVRVESTVRVPFAYTPDTIFLDFKQDERAMALVAPLLKGSMFDFAERSHTEEETISQAMLAAMLDYTPLHNLLSFGRTTREELDRVIAELNLL